MDEPRRTYCCIDLKSFYASVECVDRKKDPYVHRLVVADASRTEKTICLAVSPALKELGVPGRCRLFEVPKELDFETAKPRMRRYMEVSAQIVAIYLRYVSAADLHVYSIDECFIDLTPYLALYKKSAKELVDMLREAVLAETKITATAGIGPNLFLAKVALDVTAKHADDNIGVLDEASFRDIIWHHRPITDIWQIGRGIAGRLEKFGIRDLHGVAHADVDLLYKEFGVNAEFLIDHAWGLEPCTIAEIGSYEPESTSFGNGQVLPCDYTFEEGRMILREMVDESVLDLIDKRVVTSHIHLHVGYKKAGDEDDAASSGSAYADSRSMHASDEGAHTGDRGVHAGDGDPYAGDGSAYAGGESRRRGIHHPRTSARAGATASTNPRRPKPGTYVSASKKLGFYTNSFTKLLAQVDALYCEKVDPTRAIRRINIAFGHLEPEEYATYDLFTDVEAEEEERARQDALLEIKHKFGKDAVMRGTSYKEKARGIERAHQVGGHHA